MNIAVLGGSEFALGFALAGIKNIEVIPDNASAGNAAEKIEKLLDEKIAGIVIIDAALVLSLDEKIREKVEMSIKPVFVPVSTEASQEALRRMIIKSIGVDLMRE